MFQKSSKKLLAMKGHQLVALLLLCICMPTTVVALFKDEIGKYDWFQQYVGRVGFSSIRGNSLVVGTDSGVIASLSISTGEIEWRFVLPQGEGVKQLEFTSSSIISLSTGNSIQVINNKGISLWTENFPSSSTSSNSHLFIQEENIANILVDGVFYARSLQTGKALFQKDSKSTSVSKIVRTPNSNMKFDFYVTSATNGFTSFKLASDQSAFESEKSVQAPSGVVSCQTTFQGSVCLLESSGSYSVWSTVIGETSGVSQKVQASSDAKLIVLEYPFVAVTSKQGTHILETSAKAITQIGTINNRILSASSFVSEKYISVIAINEQNKIELVTIVGSRFTSQKQLTVELSNPERLVLTSIDSFVVVGKDDSLSFVSKDSVKWQREEALAQITNVEFVELPSADSDFVKDQTTIGFSQRLQMQWSHLISLPTAALPSRSVGPVLTKDSFGLRKLIVVGTSSGLILALHSEKGVVVWKRFVENARDSIKNIFLTRTHLHPELVVVVENNNGARLVSINAHSGENVKTTETTSNKFILTPFVDSNGNHALFGSNCKNLASCTVQFFPENEFSNNLRTTKQSNFFFSNFILNGSILTSQSAIGKSGVSFVGYGFQTNNVNELATEVWSLNFAATEQLESVTFVDQREPYSSAARILGDRNALPKYLNKNLVLLVTSNNPKRTPTTSKLNVYLVDSVTGTIVHQINHNEASGPVHSVITENVVVYHFWNSRTTQFEVVVLELYENSIDWTKTSYTAFSYATIKPMVMSQSYFFASPLSALSVTTTARGITNKQFLFGLTSGQVLGVHKSLLDPRRPPKTNVSATDKEEGLIPYETDLPILERGYLNYFHQVRSLRGIKTAPVTLESTSLVFAYGVDLFFTQTKPSGAFDMLDSEFGYFSLFITSLFLLIMAIFTGWYSKRTELKRLWH